MSKQTILITGATGLLGPFLVEAATGRGSVLTLARKSGDFQGDLGDAEFAHDTIRSAAPDIVIHAAAMTDVDGCERCPSQADRANHRAAANISRVLSKDARFVYISTDQVYPDVAGPHVEESEAPANEYGKSKLSGEKAVLSHSGGVVARANFFATSRTPDRNSLSDFFIESFSNGRPVTLFQDVLFSPLHATTLAGIIMELVDRRAVGTYNVASREGCSKAEFALQVADHLVLETAFVNFGVSSSMPSRAPRANDLRMDPGKLESLLGRRMPTLEEEIRKL